MKQKIIFPIIAFLSSFLLTAQTSKSVFKDLDLILVEQNNTEQKFIIGENIQSFTAERTIDSFRINKYETTYNLWYTVRIKSEFNGYKFQNPGQEGAYGRRGKAPTEKGLGQPVTMINWYDAIVWCNALSELEGKTPCYTYEGKVLRDSTNTATCDLAECNWDADGYRLPTETEWEYAARKNENNFQRGDLASGQTTSENEVAWFSENTNTSKPVGTTGSPFAKDITIIPGSGQSNFLGLFDMSGNLLEYCWDWFSEYTEQKGRAVGPEYGSQRVSRGGSWSPYTQFIFTADRYAFDPNEFYNYMGFRICTSSLK